MEIDWQGRSIHRTSQNLGYFFEMLTGLIVSSQCLLRMLRERVLGRIGITS
jgi:hypothetical protein